MASALLPGEAFDVVKQLYRCPNHHMTEVVWNMDSVCRSIDADGLRLRCPRCAHSMVATRDQAKSLLEALGLWTSRVDG